MGRRSYTEIKRARRLAEPHRANPNNPDTAHCVFWLSPGQLLDAHERHVAFGRIQVSESDCPCGNHTRREYR